MTEFKIGDRVVVKGHRKDDEWNERHATVTGVLSDAPWPYEISDVNDESTYLKGDEIALDESPPAAIYVVSTSNIDGDLYYATRQDALDFVGDQIDMGFDCTIAKRETVEIEAQRLLATMD